MQTKCPHCHTVFSIDETLLKQAQGQVRCGHCLAIFVAESNTDESPVNELSNETIEQSAIYIEADNEASSSAPLTDVIPPELRAESRSPKSHYGLFSTASWTLAILLMLVAGVLQYAYYDRYRLVQFTELRPALEFFCQYAKCDLPSPRDPSRIELNNKNIFSHPNAENALMISASIVNQADFEQAFPLLEVKFENIRGETITGRRFTPEEYLGIPENQISNMSPGDPVSISIEIIDPGKDMVSYTFEFL